MKKAKSHKFKQTHFTPLHAETSMDQIVHLAIIYLSKIYITFIVITFRPPIGNSITIVQNQITGI